MNLQKVEHAWTKCYCGGFMLSIFSKEKVTNLFNPRPYTYKKPRWQLVNCFPPAMKKQMEAKANAVRG